MGRIKVSYSKDKQGKIVQVNYTEKNKDGSSETRHYKASPILGGLFGVATGSYQGKTKHKK